MTKKDERRIFQRSLINARAKVSHAQIGSVIYTIRDMSDGGVYVMCDSKPFPNIGSVVRIQVVGLPIEAPELEMVVVRRGPDGYGLQFAFEQDAPS